MTNEKQAPHADAPQPTTLAGIRNAARTASYEIADSHVAFSNYEHTRQRIEDIIVREVSELLPLPAATPAPAPGLRELADRWERIADRQSDKHSNFDCAAAFRQCASEMRAALTAPVPTQRKGKLVVGIDWGFSHSRHILIHHVDGKLCCTSDYPCEQFVQAAPIEPEARAAAPAVEEPTCPECAMPAGKRDYIIEGAMYCRNQFHEPAVEDAPRELKVSDLGGESLRDKMRKLCDKVARARDGFLIEGKYVLTYSAIVEEFDAALTGEDATPRTLLKPIEPQILEIVCRGKHKRGGPACQTTCGVQVQSILRIFNQMQIDCFADATPRTPLHERIISLRSQCREWEQEAKNDENFYNQNGMQIDEACAHNRRCLYALFVEKLSAALAAATPPQEEKK